MFNENNKGIGVYLIYSVVFHAALAGLIIYLSIRYRPVIQSIGSKVVVSVVSRVPGHLASVRSILYPSKPKESVQPVSKPLPAEVRKPVLNKSSSMVYPKKVKQNTVQNESRPSTRPYVPSLSSNAYARLKSMVSLNNAYSRIQGSVLKGNIHRFQGYVNKIVSIITSNFNISLNKYLNYKSVVAFQISESGRIYGVRLIKSSGNGYFDSQSTSAVILSSPLPPPPKGFMSFVNSNNSGEGALIIFNPKEILKDRP